MTRQITAYDIPKDVLDRDYCGAGRAWAAIVDDRVVALRYMSQGTYPLKHPLGNWGGEAQRQLPAWVQAVNNNAEGRDDRFLPTAWSSRGLSKLAAAASACDDCPTKPRQNGTCQARRRCQWHV